MEGTADVALEELCVFPHNRQRYGTFARIIGGFSTVGIFVWKFGGVEVWELVLWWFHDNFYGYGRRHALRGASCFWVYGHACSFAPYVVNRGVSALRRLGTTILTFWARDGGSRSYCCLARCGEKTVFNTILRYSCYIKAWVTNLHQGRYNLHLHQRDKQAFYIYILKFCQPEWF